MNKITFSDGMTFDTDGDYRIEERHDGLYVVGRGLLCYVKDKEEGEQMIEMMRPKPQGMDKCSDCDRHMTRLWYGRPMCDEHYWVRFEKAGVRDQEEMGGRDDEATS